MSDATLFGDFTSRDGTRHNQWGAARHTDPDTSQRAARAVVGGPVVSDIEAYLRRFGAATADEVCTFLDPGRRRWPTYKSALSRMIAAGVARDTGVERPSVLGAAQRVVALRDLAGGY